MKSIAGKITTAALLAIVAASPGALMAQDRAGGYRRPVPARGSMDAIRDADRRERELARRIARDADASSACTDGRVKKGDTCVAPEQPKAN